MLRWQRFAGDSVVISAVCVPLSASCQHSTSMSPALWGALNRAKPIPGGNGGCGPDWLEGFLSGISGHSTSAPISIVLSTHQHMQSRLIAGRCLVDRYLPESRAKRANQLFA